MFRRRRGTWITLKSGELPGAAPPTPNGLPANVQPAPREPRPGTLTGEIGRGLARLWALPWPWKFTIAGVVVGAAVLANVTQDSEAPTAKPGDAAAYAAIEAETDCAALQGRFDAAEATTKRDDARTAGVDGHTWNEIGQSYMRAADSRLKALGCY